MSLTDAELVTLRATAEEYLPGTAIIQSKTFVSDGGGGGTTTWSAAGTVSCRLAPIVSAGANEPTTGGRIAPEADYIVTLPFDAVVTEDSRIVIGSETYEVGLVRDRSWNVTTRVEVERVE